MVCKKSKKKMNRIVYFFILFFGTTVLSQSYPVLVPIYCSSYGEKECVTSCSCAYCNNTYGNYESPCVEVDSLSSIDFIDYQCYSIAETEKCLKMNERDSQVMMWTFTGFFLLAIFTGTCSILVYVRKWHSRVRRYEKVEIL